VLSFCILNEGTFMKQPTIGITTGAHGRVTEWMCYAMISWLEYLLPPCMVCAAAEWLHGWVTATEPVLPDQELEHYIESRRHAMLPMGEMDFEYNPN
jgi:hypothetical protein